MPTDTPEQEPIKVADLIVGLRNALTERQRELDLASKAIKDRDSALAERNEQIGNLTAELEAMRQGVDVYRLASASVRQWEDAVGALIWPLKLSTAVCHPQQPWHLGDVPLHLTSVPGIEWETEIKSGDGWIKTGAFHSADPTFRHRPTNLTWEAVYRLAAPYLGKTHCLSGHPRLEDSQIAAWFEPGKEGPEIVAARIEYQTAYSQAVEFLRPAAVTVAATTKAANLCGERREYLKPLYEAPESRPFRFVDILGRPISWTLLDPKMPATGSPPQKEVSEKPGVEYRQGLRPKIFEKLTDIIWDDQRTPHFASRPVNATWAEVQRRAAEILGREDCLAGRERLTSEGVYEAVGMTHEDRAKTDGAAVAYQKAYSDAVEPLHISKITKTMVFTARLISCQMVGVSTAKVIYRHASTKLPIAWKLLDPDINIEQDADHRRKFRGGVAAFSVLMKIFSDGSKFTPSDEDKPHIATLGQDGLIFLSPDDKYMVSVEGKELVTRILGNS